MVTSGKKLEVGSWKKLGCLEVQNRVNYKLLKVVWKWLW